MHSTIIHNAGCAAKSMGYRYRPHVSDHPPPEATQVLRRLAMPVFVPIIAGNLGLTMLVPVLPLYLTDSGLSLRLASIVLAALGLGASLGGLPTGALMGRFGERVVLIVAIAVFATSTAVLGVTTTALVLAALRLASGAANGAIRLSRQTYITRRVEVGVRGRAMSMIGGSFRVSLFGRPGDRRCPRRPRRIHRNVRDCWRADRDWNVARHCWCAITSHYSTVPIRRNELGSCGRWWPIAACWPSLVSFRCSLSPCARAGW